MKRILLLPFRLLIPLSAHAQATLSPIFGIDTANVRRNKSVCVYIAPRGVGKQPPYRKVQSISSMSKTADGEIRSTVEVPEGIKIIPSKR
ncbi:hypothetical protein [Phocaeicola abscessus]|uniref:hypothetical protein n=1 Tax=Phocaeicola abscessus TaxID=555313 RepID=UPI0028E56FDF|nr:hypothetical protein [Phocaeicola abscessus]